MPITKVGSTITETAPAQLARFMRTGVMMDSEFAICDENDVIKQIKFNATPLLANSSCTITAPANAASVVITLPATTGTLPLSTDIPTNALPQALQYSAPTAGATVTMTAGKTALVLEPAGTLATLTVVLPTAPSDGTVVKVVSTQIVTALTLSAGGSDTIVTAITALAVAVGKQLVYRASTSKWYVII